jgi:hypothetical protein
MRVSQCATRASIALDERVPSTVPQYRDQKRAQKRAQ